MFKNYSTLLSLRGKNHTSNRLFAGEMLFLSLFPPERAPRGLVTISLSLLPGEATAGRSKTLVSIEGGPHASAGDATQRDATAPALPKPRTPLRRRTWK